MGAKNFKLGLSERKYHILTAFRLYQVEMYLLQKSTQTFENKDGVKFKGEGMLEDYQTQKSVAILFETVAVFEKDLWNKLNTLEVPDAVAMVVEYLTGKQMKAKNMGEEPKPQGAKSDAANAIQAKDITDKTKIIKAKTIPPLKKI